MKISVLYNNKIVNQSEETVMEKVPFIRKLSFLNRLNL